MTHTTALSIHSMQITPYLRAMLKERYHNKDKTKINWQKLFSGVLIRVMIVSFTFYVLHH